MDYENANCKLRVSQCADMEALPMERPLKANMEVSCLDELLVELHRVFSSDYVNVEYVSQLMSNYKSNPKDWKKYAKFDRYKYTRNLVDAGNGAFNIMVLCWGPGHASAIHDHADSHCFMKILSGTLDEARYDWPEECKPKILKEIVNNGKKHCVRCNKRNELNSEYEIKTKISEDLEQNGGQEDSCQSEVCRNGKCEEIIGHNGKCEFSESQGMVELARTKLEENDVCYINDTLGLHRVENPSHADGAVSLHLYCPPFDACRVFDARTGHPSRAQVTFWSLYGKKRSSCKITQENIITGDN